MQAPEGYLRQLTEGGQLPCNSKKKKKKKTFLDSKPSVQLSRRQARWQEFLSRFDFKWEYRKGVLMLLTLSVAALHCSIT